MIVFRITEQKGLSGVFKVQANNPDLVCESATMATCLMIPRESRRFELSVNSRTVIYGKSHNADQFRDAALSWLNVLFEQYIQ